jgi:hypothetical protein
MISFAIKSSDSKSSAFPPELIFKPMPQPVRIELAQRAADALSALAQAHVQRRADHALPVPLALNVDHHADEVAVHGRGLLRDHVRIFPAERARLQLIAVIA